MSLPNLLIHPGHPDFLDLPWDESVSDWEHDRIVEMPAGVHRHPVVFVAYDEGVYVVKELPHHFAQNEYSVLTELENRTYRSAPPVGLVHRGWVDDSEEHSAAVITQYVTHTFPYRRLIAGIGFGKRRARLLDSVAGLLVELHLAGCYWGDCSLSNLLYRYDGGAIEAVMIDAETSYLRETLSDGQRFEDLEVMKMNLAGEMADIAAEKGVGIDQADLSLGEDVEETYLALWEELNADLIITRDEGFRIRERIARLNDLGFSVDDVELDPTDEGNLVQMRVHVGNRKFNSDRLRQLTGLAAKENQARLLLGDLSYFLAKNGYASDAHRAVGVFAWLSGVYEPIVSQIRTVWPGDDPVQGYCDFLNHRMRMATERGFDVENDEALSSWMESGFPGFD